MKKISITIGEAHPYYFVGDYDENDSSETAIEVSDELYSYIEYLSDQEDKLDDVLRALNVGKPVVIADFFAELQKDKSRLDWLADRKNTIGNVQLPTQCVVDHPDDMRAAIDAAMALCAGE